MTEPNDLKGELAVKDALVEVLEKIEKFSRRDWSHNGYGASIDFACYSFLRTHGARLKRALEDAERIDWLGSQTVDVRKPMFYGSHRRFIYSPQDDEVSFEHTTLRAEIDTARVFAQRLEDINTARASEQTT